MMPSQVKFHHYSELELKLQIYVRLSQSYILLYQNE